MLILITGPALAKIATDLALTSFAFGETVEVVVWSEALQFLEQQQLTSRLTEFGITQIYVLTANTTTTVQQTPVNISCDRISPDELRSKIADSSRVETF